MAVLPEDNGCPALAWCQDYEGNVLWEIPKTYSLPEDNRVVLETDRNVPGMLDVFRNSTNTMQDTAYLVGRGKIHPLFTVSFGQTEQSSIGYKEDNYKYSGMVLPDYVVMNVSKQGKSVRKEGVLHINVESLPGVILDRRTGEVYLGELVNDLVDGSFAEEFKDGCLVVRSDAVSFMENGRTALESGRRSTSSARSFPQGLRIRGIHSFGRSRENVRLRHSFGRWEEKSFVFLGTFQENVRYYGKIQG